MRQTVERMSVDISDESFVTLLANQTRLTHPTHFKSLSPHLTARYAGRWLVQPSPFYSRPLSLSVVDGYSDSTRTEQEL